MVCASLPETTILSPILTEKSEVGSHADQHLSPGWLTLNRRTHQHGTPLLRIAPRAATLRAASSRGRTLTIAALRGLPAIRSLARYQRVRGLGSECCWCVDRGRHLSSTVPQREAVVWGLLTLVPPVQAWKLPLTQLTHELHTQHPTRLVF